MTEQDERDLRERRELVEHELELDRVERDELAALRGRELMAYHRRLATEQARRLEEAS